MWSLAVEEQFYLIWPWLILFVSRKNIKYVLFSGIVISISTMFLVPLLSEKKDFVVYLTPSCFDAFCWGGLLSYAQVYYKQQLMNYSTGIMVIALSAIVLYILSIVFKLPVDFYSRTLISVFVAWILFLITTNKTGYFNSILGNKVLISIGKISYGIYLYHNFIPTLVNSVFHWFNKKNHSISYLNQFIESVQSEQSIYSYIIYIIVLLAISFMSFYLIEKPFLKLKTRFE